MATHGLIEGFLETRLRTRRCYSGIPLQPQLLYGTADITNMTEAPENPKSATIPPVTGAAVFSKAGPTVAFFTGAYFQNTAAPVTGGIVAEFWAASIERPRARKAPSHVVARSCVPVPRGTVSGPMAVRYSPNGEANDAAEQGVEHASMTAGDFVQIERHIFVCCLDGILAAFTHCLLWFAKSH